MCSLGSSGSVSTSEPQPGPEGLQPGGKMNSGAHKSLGAYPFIAFRAARSQAPAAGVRPWWETSVLWPAASSFAISYSEKSIVSTKLMSALFEN